MNSYKRRSAFFLALLVASGVTGVKSVKNDMLRK